MRGFNQVWVSGNVGGRVLTGKTREDNPACSFSIAAENPARGATWIRVNAYGSLALRVEKRLTKGMYVIVLGELMNREGQFGELTEVRAKDIVFIFNNREKLDVRQQGQEGSGQQGPEPDPAYEEVSAVWGSEDDPDGGA